MPMRVGPFEIASRETIRAARLNTAPIGAPGNRIIHVSDGTSGTAYGLRDDVEYISELSDARRYREYDRMRNDGTVHGVLRGMMLPVRSAPWFLTPASDDEMDVMIAAWVEDNLLRGMKTTWDVVLYNALLKIVYGSMPFEPIFELVDDEAFRRPLYRLRRMAVRHPRTVSEWLTDGDGDFAGIVQRAWKDGEYREIKLPGDDLVLFVNDQEAGDFRGTSVLRGAWGHWRYKNGLYRIDAVSIERRNSGIDVGTIGGATGAGGAETPTPANGNANQNTKFYRDSQRSLETVRTGARNYLIEVPGFTYRIQGIEGSTIDAHASIEHHNKQIARSMLMEYILMGDSEGARAVHTDKSSLALMGLRAVAGEICETINRHLIPKWCNANWAGMRAYPKLEHGRLDMRDIATIVDAVEGLVPLGIVNPDGDMEGWFRELLELPEKLDDDDGFDPDNERPGEEGDARRQTRDARRRARQAGEARPPRVRAATARTRRLSAAETRVDWPGLKTALDTSTARMVRDVKGTQRRQIENLVEVGQRILDRAQEGTPLDELTRQVSGVTVRYQATVAEAVERELVGLYRVGQESIAAEFAAQGARYDFARPLDPADVQRVREFLGLRARALAALLSDRIRSAWTWEMLSQIRDGRSNRGALTAALVGLADREIQKLAGNTVSEALNLGRDGAAEENVRAVRRVEYSALMDGGTCGPCSSLDGTTFDFGSPEYRAARPPFRECKGRGRCRCVYVYVFADEAE